MTAKAGTDIGGMSDLTFSHRQPAALFKIQRRYGDSSDYHHGDTKVKDFIKKNISGNTKSAEYEKQANLISRVHQKILKRKDYVLDLAGLSQI